MNIWTFLDRNAEALWWLAVILIVSAGSCGIAAHSGEGCRIQIGSPPAQVADGGTDQ
jgi:hypothetical protein